MPRRACIGKASSQKVITRRSKVVGGAITAFQTGKKLQEEEEKSSVSGGLLGIS